MNASFSLRIKTADAEKFQFFLLFSVQEDQPGTQHSERREKTGSLRQGNAKRTDHLL